MTANAVKEIDNLTFAEQRAGQFAIGMADLVIRAEKKPTLLAGLSDLNWTSDGTNN